MKSLVAFILLAVFVPSITLADTIAIIGTGSVAKALGPEFAEQGHTIVYGPGIHKAKKRKPSSK